MKNVIRQLCSLLLGAVIEKDSATSTVSKSILVAMGLLCICSGHALAGADSGGLDLTAPSAPTVMPSDPEAQLNPEQGRLYYDRFVTGDWGGLRTLLHNRGVDFNLDYFGELAESWRLPWRQ